MTESSRTLKVGVLLMSLVVVGLVTGFVLLRSNTDAAKPRTSPTITPTEVKVQVEQAYLHYWDVYADAMLHLDSSHLSEVLADKALTHHLNELQTQRTKDQPVRISVEHDYIITKVNATTYSIDDNFINHSVRLDPKTMQPIESDPKKRIRRSYNLEKVNETWKVTLVVGFKS